MFMTYPIRMNGANNKNAKPKRIGNELSGLVAPSALSYQFCEAKQLIFFSPVDKTA